MAGIEGVKIPCPMMQGVGSMRFLTKEQEGLMKPQILLIVGVLVLTGCGQPMPPLNFSVPNVGLSQQRHDAEVKSITVTMARPDEQVGQIDHLFTEGAAALANVWHTALEEALNRSLIFRDDGAKKVSLAVKVLKLDVPAAGVTFTTEAVARYELIDRSTGDIIFTRDITASGATPIDFAFLGVVRARESINRAVQNNISLFLQDAQSININKPMFPAKG